MWVKRYRNSLDTWIMCFRHLESQTHGIVLEILEMLGKQALWSESEVAQLRLTLFDPTVIHRILQARILEWVAVPSPDLSNPGIKPRSPTLQVDSLPAEPPGKPKTSSANAKSLQSCPTLCDPIDSSPSGSPVPGIPQARTLEWVAISSRWCEKNYNKWK